MTITEKIDGTNSAVIITDDGEVAAQSRNRLITPGKTTDNCGFAAWVEENEWSLRYILGPGRHFGEWWGAGIQRKYGKTDRRFSLFNVKRYRPLIGEGGQDGVIVPGLDTVPVLYEGEEFGTQIVRDVMDNLARTGSVASPGFMNPEGVIVFLHASKSIHKVTFEYDGMPKSLAPTG